MRYENEESQRGASCAEFRVNNGRVVLCLAISSVMFLVSVSLIAAGFLVAFAEPVINKRVLLTLLGACGVVLSSCLFASNWRKYGQQVVVFSEGFEFFKGGRRTLVPWDDIVAVWRHSATIEGSRALAETNLWVQRKDGETIYLTSFFVDMPRLAETVLTETARRLVPEKRLQLERGETVEFGSLTISATGLAASGRTLAWNDADVRIAHGAIDVRRKSDNGPWYYTPIRRMPNYHVFLALAEGLVTVA